MERAAWSNVRRAVGWSIPVCSLVAAGLTALVLARGGPAPSPRAFGAIVPQVSPGGDAIAFSHQGAIWRMPREGGEMRRLTSAEGFDVHPAWSPDGKRLGYVDARAGDVHVLDAVTGKVQKALPGVAVAGPLRFHPDGRRALARFSDGSLAWLDLESGGVKTVAPRAAAFALSPDGDRIAYVTTQDRPGEQTGSFGPEVDLWVVPSGGGDAKKLTRSRARVYDMWWAPETIVFATDLGASHVDLWSLSPEDPGHAHRLTSGQADEEAPSVSADGRWLVYTDNREGATALRVRDMVTGDERTVVPTRLDHGAPTGTLGVDIVQKGTGEPLAARVSVRQRDGKDFAPLGSLYRVVEGVGIFHARGHADLVVPAGRYTVLGTRGLDHRPAARDVEVRAGRRVTVRLELERWHDPAARSLWSGESHIHANYGPRGAGSGWYATPENVRLQIEGEGLNVANFVVANSDGEGVFDREFFRGAPDPVSTATSVLSWNQEFRATLWGHMTFYRLKRLVEPIFTGFKDTTNPWDVPTNADVAAHVHLQGGHVNYAHPVAAAGDPFLAAYSAREIPVDVALGLIDSLDINSVGFAGVPLWYRLLNCGFHLPASAGTDAFLNVIWNARPPGRERAYVRVDGPFSYDAWVAGLRAGRSFVTDGPMLELAVGERGERTPGDTVALPAPGEVRVRAVATSGAPLDRAELIYNGAVVATGTPAADPSSARIEQRVRLDRSGWLGLRAYGGKTQAHTSPVYVQVAGKRAGARADARFFLGWIDRLEAKLAERDRVPGAALKARVSAQLDAARAVYGDIAASGPD